jgi:hypothetical protein
VLTSLRFFYGLSVFAHGQAPVQLGHLPLLSEPGLGSFLARALPPHPMCLLPAGLLLLQLFLPADDQIREADHVALYGFGLFDAPRKPFLAIHCQVGLNLILEVCGRGLIDRGVRGDFVGRHQCHIETGFACLGTLRKGGGCRFWGELFSILFCKQVRGHHA